MIVIEELVAKHQVKIEVSETLTSRCWDCFCKTDENHFFLKPGGDLGDLATLLTTNSEHGLDIAEDDLVGVFLETLGTKGAFSLHSSTPSECTFLNTLFDDPEAFSLSSDDITLLNNIIAKSGVSQKGASTILAPQAVLIVESDIWTLAQAPTSPIYIHHKKLDDARRRKLAKNLLSLITLPVALSQEYLYEALSLVADNQLLEVVSRLPEKPTFFKVTIENSGAFEVVEL